MADSYETMQIYDKLSQLFKNSGDKDESKGFEN